MLPNRPELTTEATAGTVPPFTVSAGAQRTAVAAALGLLATIPALLLSGAPRAIAIGGIWAVVAWFVDFFRFEVDPQSRIITVRQLWWGFWKRRSTTYSFDDVGCLRRSDFGYGQVAYRWEFRDGATYYLLAPIEERLIHLFYGGSKRAHEAFENRLAKVIGMSALLVWTAVTFACDGIVGRDLARQVRSHGYFRVAGRLLKSEVKAFTRDGEGIAIWNFEPDVEYSYSVNGVDYTGTRFRYASSRFSAAAARLLLPTGPEVLVYYNPVDPGDAIVSPGLQGLDLLTLLSLFPANVVVLVGAGAWLQRRRDRTTGGIFVRDDGRVARAGGSRWGALVAAFAASGAVALVLIFAIGYPTGGNPSLPVALLGWLFVAGAGLLAWGATRRAVAKGRRDLIVDRDRQTLTLPVACGRREPLTIPWASLSDIGVDDTDDESETVHYTAVAVVALPDGTTGRERLADPQTESCALALAAWVRGVVKRARS